MSQLHKSVIYVRHVTIVECKIYLIFVAIIFAWLLTLFQLASPRAAFSDGEGEAPAAGPGQGEPEAMSERHMREAASVIDVFGLPLVRIMFVFS